MFSWDMLLRMLHVTLFGYFNVILKIGNKDFSDFKTFFFSSYGGKSLSHQGVYLPWGGVYNVYNRVRLDSVCQST